MATSFQDNFSKQSGAYRQYRPSYPIELFAYLSSLTKEHTLAWDCGTGNGQSALNLAKFYDRVYATDPSPQQIQHAQPHPAITYQVEQAEHTQLGNHSADLITVAQALHWFNFEVFYAEVKRVLKQDGILAVWTYGLPVISPEIDKVLKFMHDEVLKDYWRKENKLVDQKYVTIPFPFQETTAPIFENQKELTLPDLLGLLHTWSAVQRYKDETGENPVKQIVQDLSTAWNTTEKRIATWQIFMRIGKVSD